MIIHLSSSRMRNRKYIVVLLSGSLFYVLCIWDCVIKWHNTQPKTVRSFPTSQRNRITKDVTGLTCSSWPLSAREYTVLRNAGCGWVNAPHWAGLSSKRGHSESDGYLPVVTRSCSRVWLTFLWNSRGQIWRLFEIITFLDVTSKNERVVARRLFSTAELITVRWRNESDVLRECNRTIFRTSHNHFLHRLLFLLFPYAVVS